LNVQNNGNFSFELSLKPLVTSSNNHIRFFFGLKDLKNYHFLDMTHSDLYFGSMVNDKEETISHVKLENKLYSMVDNIIKIIYLNEYFEIILNEKIVMKMTVPDSIFQGRLGFGSRVGDIIFDNLSYTRNLQPLFGDNFFDAWIRKIYFKDPTKTRHIIDFSPWSEISGIWDYKKHMCFAKCNEFTSYALMVNGKYFWKNYEVMCAIKIPQTGFVGICFYYNDINNYYRFESERNNSGKYDVRLIRKHNGIEKVIASDQVEIPFNNDRWNKFRVKIFGDKIKGYINEKELIYVQDSIFNHGRIGLYTTSHQSLTSFDDVFVKSINSLEDDEINTYDYIFDTRERSSLILSDWEINRKHYVDPNIPFLRIEKPLLANAYIKNKRKISFEDASLNIVFRKKLQTSQMVTSIILDNTNGKEYGIEITDKFARLLKDRIIIQEFSGINSFKKLTLENKDGIIILKADDQCIVEYKVSHPFCAEFITLDFSGIAEKFIDIRRILIQKS
jgi:hypothetical protein